MASLPSPTQVARDHLGLFESWFKVLDPNSCGTIQAGAAAQFLKKSGLNDNILSRIWDLSDPGGKGYLDKSGLFAALKMVALAQNGKEPNLANISIVTPPPNMGDLPPPHPPPPVAKSPGPPMVPAPPRPNQSNDLEVWTITPADRVRYDQIFNSLGPEANKIHGNKVRGVMLNSKLPMDILGKIWDHADMDKDGSLDRVEFSIAMHLIYKVLENNTLPTTLPQEMLSSARRAGVAAQGPVPAPLAPPTPVQSSSVDVNKLQNTGPPPAPWVVSAADKSRYDVMFHNADLDKDGFVSGQEIKGVFLQSGLPQMVLAHIWNICDMKQTGKLTSEQFALAMWLIQQKIAGIDPPSTLTTEMIPPTMRPKPSGEIAQVVAKPIYSNPELQKISDEIDEVGKDRCKLEADIQVKEASIRLKNNEAKNLQTELDTLTATFRQLENQKGAAQKKLDDLGQQVEALRVQVEEQESSLKSQEDEVLSKQKELDSLRNQEIELENSLTNVKKRIEHFANTQQQTQLFISQAKAKMEELQEQEVHMTEVLTSFDLAISSSDASSLTEACLMDVTPLFNDPSFMAIGPTSPNLVTSPLDSPKSYQPETNGLPNSSEIDMPKGKDTSFIDGHDPFAQAFGGHQTQADPFASWDHRSANHQPAAKVDPFGGDTFAATKADVFGNEPFNSAQDSAPSESPTPALPPKKSKQPPPRPAPPKTRPARPPPHQKNSNNNQISNDTFTGGWQEGSKSNNASSKNSGFADFANFADFESKYSSTTSSSLRSPWDDGHSGLQGKKDPFGAPLLQPLVNTRSSLLRSEHKLDPFEDAFGIGKFNAATTNSPWPINSPSSGFGSQNGSDHLPLDSGDNFGSEDPFGGDYDPFKDTTVIKEADAFSWDDEQDGAFTDSVSDGSFAPPFSGHKDPFCLSSDDSPENKRITHGNLDHKKTLLQLANTNGRSKSALGDPLFSLKQINNSIPLRSKTSLGNPGKLDLDFDPLSTISKMEFPSHKSNEDLLNENLLPFVNAVSAGSTNGNPSWSSLTGKTNNNLTLSSAGIDPFASFDNSWTTKDSSKLEDECRRKRLEEQERADLEYAIALSHSQNHTNMPTSYKQRAQRSSRSPSTGL